jgi:three-Cys-motif partner protein
MGTSRRHPSGDGTHRFGGDWTETKLEIISKYLGAYTTALKAQPFRKAYIDAFAGSGYRSIRADDGDEGQLAFAELAEEQPQLLLEGSARRALRTSPRFDKYFFIEQSAERCAQLEQMKTEYPELSRDIVIHQGEANASIRALCSGTDWALRRAVMFLDPYGLQVEWPTLESIARTRAIDLWLLFPLGMGVNRMLDRSGQIPESWRERLNLLLGTDAWYDEFYRFERKPTLFGDCEESVIKASTETIGRYFVRRLETIFAAVSPEPKVLVNSRNCPLYLLCFAMGNEKGARLALKIANNILGKMR